MSSQTQPELVESAKEDLKALTASRPTSSLMNDIREAYFRDPDMKAVFNYISNPTDKRESSIPAHYRSQLHRFAVDDDLLWYRSAHDDDYCNGPGRPLTHTHVAVRKLGRVGPVRVVHKMR